MSRNMCQVWQAKWNDKLKANSKVIHNGKWYKPITLEAFFYRNLIAWD